MIGLRCLGLLALAAALPLSARDPLPQPLRLPPGLRQVLPLNPAASFMGDAVRIVDCPEEKYAPFGTCGNLLFGGMALYNTPLSGFVEIRFYPPVRDVAHFEISHPGNLRGENTVMKAPQFYEMPVAGSFILDDLGGVSSGDLNLLTGEVTNLNYQVNFFNSFYSALTNVNPKLRGGVFRFPGIYGAAHASFEQRPDGLLDFTLSGSTFLPLSNNISGDPVRIPLPFCGPNIQCGSIQGPGSSLHPRINLSTKPLDGPECGSKCPEITPNSIQVLTVVANNSFVADRFNLNIPQLGGNRAVARSHMQGRVQIQFGERVGDTIPFVTSLLPPEALLAAPPESPLDVLGISLGLIGHQSDLGFPRQTYRFKDVVMIDDPLDISIGVLDLRTGRAIGDVLYRGFFLQTLLLTILEINNGAIAPSSFPYRGPVVFEKGRNGELIFRYDSGFFLPFADFVFPAPDYTRANAFVAGPGSELNPLLKVQAVERQPSSGVRKSGSGELVSGVGDRFTYTYSVPCDPQGGGAAFEYTNHSTTSRNGTFKMNGLAGASCTNSLNSTMPAGDFDMLTFSGFGSWSADEELHLATVQISEAPGGSHVTIQIDGGQLSEVNTPPAAEPVP